MSYHPISYLGSIKGQTSPFFSEKLQFQIIPKLQEGNKNNHVLALKHTQEMQDLTL